VKLEKKQLKERDGYKYIEAGNYTMLVDKRFHCRARVSVYLNENGRGNILDIEGVEL